MSNTGGRIAIRANPEGIYDNDSPRVVFQIQYDGKDAVLQLSGPALITTLSEQREQFYGDILREFCNTVLSALDKKTLDWHHK